MAGLHSALDQLSSILRMAVSTHEPLYDCLADQQTLTSLARVSKSVSNSADLLWAKRKELCFQPLKKWMQSTGHVIRSNGTLLLWDISESKDDCAVVAERCTNFLRSDASASERCHRATKYAWPWVGGSAICLCCAELQLVDQYYCKQVLGLVDLADQLAVHLPPRPEGEWSCEVVYRLSDARALALDFWGQPAAFNRRAATPLEPSQIMAQTRMRAAIADSVSLHIKQEDRLMRARLCLWSEQSYLPARQPIYQEKEGEAPTQVGLLCVGKAADVGT